MREGSLGLVRKRGFEGFRKADRQAWFDSEKFNAKTTEDSNLDSLISMEMSQDFLWLHSWVDVEITDDKEKNAQIELIKEIFSKREKMVKLTVDELLHDFTIQENKVTLREIVNSYKVHKDLLSREMAYDPKYGSQELGDWFTSFVRLVMLYHVIEKNNFKNLVEKPDFASLMYNLEVAITKELIIQTQDLLDPEYGQNRAGNIQPVFDEDIIESLQFAHNVHAAVNKYYRSIQ